MGFSEGLTPLGRGGLVALGPGRPPGQVGLCGTGRPQDGGPFFCLAGSLALLSLPSELVEILALPTHWFNSVRWERGGSTLAFPVLAYSDSSELGVGCLPTLLGARRSECQPVSSAIHSPLCYSWSRWLPTKRCDFRWSLWMSINVHTKCEVFTLTIQFNCPQITTEEVFPFGLFAGFMTAK